MIHKCDEGCVCPLDGKPLFYSPATGEHACVDLECKNAHGMMTPELGKSAFPGRAVSINLTYDADDLDSMIAAKIQTAVQKTMTIEAPVVSYDDLVATISTYSAIQEAVRKQQEADMDRVEEAYQRALELDQGVFIVTREGRVVHAEPSPYVDSGIAYWANADAWIKGFNNAFDWPGFGSIID